MGRLRAAVASFWGKAYEDNLTGLSSMVAYNLLLSIFPLALVALFIAGRILRSRGGPGLGPARPRAALPVGRREHAERGGAPAPGVLHHDRHRRDRGRHLVRLLLLGRARHGVLPDLSPALPQLGAPEAVRARDVRGRAAVHRGQRHRARTPEPARHERRRPAVRALGGARARLRRHARGRRASCCSPRSAPRTGSCRAAGCRGTASGRERSAPRWPWASSTTASRSTCRTSRPCARGRRSCSS